ncbi:MAG: hypothetical protein C0512_08070 [Flavobacterium sp.]|nr:hypothetical protein [Flavobacterium sp.]
MFVHLILIALLFTGCLNHEVINNVESHVHNYKLETVSLEKVPYLKPVVETFAKKNKSKNKFARATSREESYSHLILDLDKILVYTPNEGYVSYSIVIKNEIENNSPYYFENLHIVEKGDSLKTLIYRWLPTNKDVKFDLKTYSGVVENYELDYTLKSMTVYENGTIVNSSIPDSNGPVGSLVVSSDCFNLAFCPCSPDGPEYCGCSICTWIVTTVCSGSGGPGGGSSSQTGSSGTGSNNGSSSSGSGGGPGSSSSGVYTTGFESNSIVVVPKPLEYEEYEGFMFDNFLNSFLVAGDDLYYWLKNPYPMGASEEIKNLIKDYVNSENADLEFARELALIIYDLKTQIEDQSLLYETAKSTIYAHENNYFSQPLDSDFFSYVDDYSLLSYIDPNNAINFARLFIAHCAVIKQENPSWSTVKVFAVAYVDTVQLLLDFAGLVPVIGEVADLTNGVIYSIQGDGVNATLSFASTIPVAGWFSAGIKFAKRADGLKLLVKANGIIDFGKRADLRKILNITDTSKQAHHIMPWAFSESNLVQKAAKSNNAFHMNQFSNGFPLPTSNHLTGHNLYNSKIQSILQANSAQIENMSPTQAYNFLTGLNNHIKGLFQANQNMNLGQISNLISYP